MGKLKKTARELGRDGAYISSVLNTRLPNSGIPAPWSIVTVYFNIYVNHLASRAQSQPTCPASETLLQQFFDVLTRETGINLGFSETAHLPLP